MSLVRIPVAALAALGLLAAGLPAQTRATALPRISPVSDPLSLRVVYPLPNQRITATDSTFLFGSTGNAATVLAINGIGIPVAPNGAFLAFVPVPRDSVFRFIARLGEDSAAYDLRVLLPRSISRPDTGLWIDETSFSPTGRVWAEPDELLRVSVVAAPRQQLAIEFANRPPLALVPDTTQVAAYGAFDRSAVRVEPREVRYVASVLARDLADSSWVIRGMTGRPALTVELIEPASRMVVILDDDTARTGNTDGAVSGTPIPNGTYHWFFKNGTPAAVSGRIGSQVRLALSAGTVAWVSAADIAAFLPAGTPEPRAQLRLVRLTPGDSFVSARLSLTGRVPFKIDEADDKLTVRFYSTRADADWLQYGESNPWIERISWEQPFEDEATVTFDLPRPVFGYRTRWDGSDLILDIRRPPRINSAAPLRGRVIAIDPGHPPAGATGPTGLREAEANLAVALALKPMLERAGARVIMTRITDTASGLYERTNQADAANADVLVSIHNNAFPDGVNPWTNNGTSTYYYQPRSARLARHVQAAMVRTMGLRDLGFGRGDLALVRVTWMPSVLTEGAFLMIPEQENGLRTPSFQRAYARGIVDGLTAFFRELSR